MVTLGPYAQLGIIAAGTWIVIFSVALACILVGNTGAWIARRSGRRCPICDYQDKPVDVAIHHALEHEREQPK